MRWALTLHRTAVVVGVLLALPGALGGLLVWTSGRVDANLEMVAAQKWQAVRLAGEAQDLSGRNAQLLISMSLLDDRSEIDRLLATRAQRTESISMILARLEPLLAGGKARAAYQAIVERRRAWLASHRRMFEMLGASRDTKETRALMATADRLHFDDSREEYRSLVDALNTEMEEGARAAMARNRRLRTGAGLAVALVELAAIAFVPFVLRRHKAAEEKRLHAEAALASANASLEERVRERTREMEETSATLRATNHQLTAVLADHEQAAADLKENREKLQKLFLAVEQASEAILIADPSGVIEYVNPAFEALTGYSLYEVVGKTPRVLKSGVQRPGFYAEMWGTIQAGNVWRGRLVNRKKDGSTYHEDMTISPIRENGRVVNFVSVARDVTREVGLEGQLLQAQKLEAVGRLAAGVAHEINTPTQFVADNTHFLRDGFAELKEIADRLAAVATEDEKPTGRCLERLREMLSDADLQYLMAEIPKAIDQSLEGLARITKIVGAMKDFSHQGSGEKKPFDLNRAIDSTVTISRNEWKYVAEMELQLEPNLPQVPMVVNEMNQVFLNLIVNAAHAISDATDGGNRRKGVINIQTRRVGEVVEVRIRDDGTGIPTEVRHRIFEQFFTTKPVGKGTGQGLSLSRAIVVDKHQGRLEFESEEGRGTTFIVSLPLVPKQVEGAKAA